MNRHFAWDPTPQEQALPKRLYAVLDHSEPTVVPDNEPGHFSFDAVDAFGLEALGDFGSETPGLAGIAWRNYWAGVLQGNYPINDPLVQVGLYRLDVLLDADDPGRSMVARTQKPEDKGHSNELRPPWLQIDILPEGQGAPAEIYPQMFGAPIPVGIKIGLPTPQRAQALDSSFSLQSLPQVTWSTVEPMLAARKADALNVFDVGQGSACALTDERFYPHVYFDLGCGVYRNKKTSPPDLAFCFSYSPVILLSHWDADHWAGAYVPARRNRTALQMTWIMPLQQVSPIHLAFAADIIGSGGQALIFDPPAGSVQSTTLVNGRELKVVRCDGTSRNDSGFAICVSEASGSDVRWLLTGDAVYNHILPFLGAPAALRFQAVVVPHHGADLSHQTMVPNPLGSTSKYQRLAFSFGPNNAHGRRSTSHPKTSSVDAHSNAGWNVGHWNGVAAPGHREAKGELRATGKNGPGCERLHTVVINWKGDLVLPLATPCGGQYCSHALKQI